MDKIDRKILFELDRNSRQTHQQIAKKLRISRDKVSYRVKQLEKQEIIRGYYTLIDFSKMGYLIYRLYLRFQNTSLEIEEEIKEYLIKDEHTFVVYQTEGDWDIALGYLIKSPQQYDEIWRKFQEKFQPYIANHNISILFNYIHYYRNYLIEKNQDTTALSVGNSQAVTIDKEDIEILKELSTNARIKLLDLAKKLNLTSSAIIYKLRQLEKRKIISGYRTIIDFEKIGFQYYKLDLNIEDIKKRGVLQEYAKNHPNIIYEDITVGGSDVEFDMEVENYNKFYEIIKNIKELFPKLIRSYRYYKATKIYKYSYFPGDLTI